MEQPKSKRKPVLIILGLAGLLVICACISVVGLYFFGDRILYELGFTDSIGGNQLGSSTTEPIVDNRPEWTVIVYSAADDEVLEEYMLLDINEMELVGSSADLNIVVQVDRYPGAYAGDGDWTEARRYLIAQDDELATIASPVVQNLGEVDMNNPQVFVDFVTWAIQNYPAQKYALIMSDHGGGWTGGFSDASAASPAGMRLPQIASSLQTIIQNTGIERFDVFAFDACLMAQIEIMAALYNYTDYLVASEEIVPAVGLAYAGFLGEVAQNPLMDGRGLAESMVSTFILTDLVYSGYTREGVAVEELGTTMSAIESARVPDLIGAMNQFISALAGLDQRQVAEARTFSRSYQSVFSESSPAPFLDLYNFSEVILSRSTDGNMQAAATQLQTAISSAVISEKHGQDMSGSSGIAFHFPDSTVYSFTELNDAFPQPYYAESAQGFLEQSYWDEFLVFHYTGGVFAPGEGLASEPDRASEIDAPGASLLTISPIQISDTEISGDETVSVSATVEGNVSFIHTALYFWDPATESYWIGDVSYYIADNTTTVDGVNFPDYGPSPIQVQLEWSPTLYTLTDGQHEAFALVEPIEYLSAQGNTVYGVYGQYTPPLGGQPVDALFHFDSSGFFLYAYAFPDADEDGTSNPIELTPQIGGQFTDYVQYYTYDAEDNPIFNYVLSEDVFTWGEEGFSFYASYPVDGDYAIGIIAYDFDNNFTASFEVITYTR